MKIGAITVGQSPRVDVMVDLYPLFEKYVEVLEIGALDGLTYEEILTFSPDDEDYVLVSRLNDGRSVTFGEKHILPRIQHGINQLEKEGAELILFFCTGEFPVKFESRVPLIFPNQILGALVPLLTGKNHITVLVPSELQIEQAKSRWEELVGQVDVMAASPYEGMKEIRLIKDRVGDTLGDLVVLDCIGYTQEMKHFLSEATGKSIILPRTLAARVIMEIADK